MTTSIFAGISGLRANQQMLDVVGNNLANANTSGYKSQRTDFADLFYQTLSPATSPTSVIGGHNPFQLGSGVKVGSINTILTQGNLEPSGSDFDLGILGNGYFTVNNGTANYYTRAGAFGVDANKYLVDQATGFTVQRFGSVGEGSLTTPPFQVPGDSRISIPFNSTVPGQATSSVTLQGNLDATAAIGSTTNSAIQVFDSQGTSHVLSVVFTKTASNTWSIGASLPTAEGFVSPVNSPPGAAQIPAVTFNLDGSLAAPPSASLTLNVTAIGAPQTVNLVLGTAGGFTGLTQFGGTSAAAAITQDGFASGFLANISVAQDGIINGVFTNGRILPLAQLGIASFANPAGLQREGNNLLSVSGQSGEPIVGSGGSGGRGLVQQGTLEASNVDVALEFTRLIIAQRGYQANTRTIVVSNEVLQELTNIIR